MKRPLSTFLLFLPLVALLFVSCSKYEEGSPSMSSKKSRLVNHWKTVTITSNGSDITALNIVTDVIIRDNNTITVNGALFGIQSSIDGGWVFNKDKSRVLVTNNDGSFDDYEIVMLQKDESKFRRYDGNGNLIEYHFVTY